MFSSFYKRALKWRLPSNLMCPIKHTAFEQIFILRMRVAVSAYWFYDQPELEKSEAVS